MALKSIVNRQEQFTGEFPAEYARDGMWRFNETLPDENKEVSDDSGRNRRMFINRWSGTTADLRNGYKGRYIRFNTNNPSTEKTYLKVTNDGSIFSSLGERVIVGGWMSPTTYSIGNTYTPIFNTRYGPGQPIFYLSLYSGRPRIMLYNSSGSLILDQSFTPTFSLTNGGWFFIAAVIEPNNKSARMMLGSRSNGNLWISNAISFTGTLNRSCTADIIMGMHADSYWYAGGFDD